MGKLHHYLHGKVKFEDKKNNMTGFWEIGNVKKMPKDYLEGYIIKDDVKVCEDISGTYMGYIDFDGERGFDIRD